MAAKFSDVNLEALPFAKQAKKVNNVLVVPFEPPVRIQTDILTATTPLCDENKDLLPSIYVQAQGPFLKFMKDFEQAVLVNAKEHASNWWTKPPSPTMIDNGFKTSFKSDDVFKLNVKQSSEPIVFDHQQNDLPDEVAGPGVKFWAVLEAHRVVIGRQEFGVVWKLSQMMLKPAVRCEITFPMATQTQTETEDGDFV